MKRNIQLKTLLLFAFGSLLLLAACGSKQEISQEEAVAQVYTSVAETLAAQPTQIPPTATLVPSATPTLVPTMTQAAPPTQVFVTATQQIATQAPCLDAIYMSDVTIPDGTIFAPGATFVKTWQIFNGGTCDWEENFVLSFSSGEEMSGVATPLGTKIPASGQAQVSVSMTAPLTEGSYTGYWQLTDADGKKFGNAIFVKIVVGSAIATTVAPAATP